MKKRWKRGIALALATVMSISLAACGGDDTSVNKQGKDENDPGSNYVYVSEFIPIEMEENAYLSDAVLIGDKLYYVVGAYDEEKGMESTELHCRQVDNPDKEESIPLQLKEIEGYDVRLGIVTFDDAGNMYTICNVYPVYVEGEEYNYDDQTIYLSKYDSNLQEIYSKDIGAALTDEMNSYISNLVVTKDGKLYGSSNNAVHVFSNEGEFEKTITLQADWISSFFATDDGKLFVCQYGMNGEEFVELDVATGKAGATYKNIPVNITSMKGGKEGKILVSGSKLYEYDPATQESTEILNWLDSNVDSSTVQDFRMLEDGRIIAFCDDYNSTTEIAILTKTERSQVAEKEVITLATLYEGDSTLQKAIVNFNKTSDKYQIALKNYISNAQEWTENTYTDALARFNADLVSNDAPDIFDLSGLDWNNLAAKGVLEDLTPYMEASTIANTKDFVPAVLAAYNMDGKQLTVPMNFGIDTLMGKSSLVGSEAGWTLDEMMAFADAHPDADLMRYITPESALSVCLRYNNETFIDYAKGTCYFDSPEFIKVLEFANRFEEEPYVDTSFPTQLQTNQVLLADVIFSDVHSYQMYHLLFEEEATCIGYPTFDGSAGVFLSGYQMYGISAQSKHKEGAWQFMESLLSAKEDEHIWQFPSRVDMLDKMLAEAMKPDYRYDENGDMMYGEDGQPLQNPKTTWGYDDWEAEIYAATQEEIDGLKAMIDIAKVAGSSDQQIYEMIFEEAQPYFEGQKSAQEVAGIIQSRVKIYIEENS